MENGKRKEEKGEIKENNKKKKKKRKGWNLPAGTQLEANFFLQFFPLFFFFSGPTSRMICIWACVALITRIACVSTARCAGVSAGSCSHATAEQKIKSPCPSVSWPIDNRTAFAIN